jgi:hypothetical protein
MKFMGAFVGVSALILGSCGTLQPIDPLNYIHTGTITRHIDCELRRAVDAFPKLADWFVKYDLSLQVDATSSVTPGASIIQVDRHVGLANAGTFNWGFGANLSGTATRIETITVKKKLNTLPICGPTPPELGLAGDLEIADGIRNIIAPAYANDPTAGGSGDVTGLLSFGHSAQFTIVAGLNATPTISLVRFKGPAPSGTLASMSRTDTNKLVMSFAKFPANLKILGANTVVYGSDLDLDRTLLLQQLQLIGPNLVR